jgi:hypothetical protein
MTYYFTPESTIYRRVENELVVVQLDTGRYFYFSPETEQFLNFFRSPHSLEQFCEGTEAAFSDIDELKQFCRFLTQKEILQVASKPASEPEIPAHSFLKPSLLREGEKTIDQISFGCP